MRRVRTAGVFLSIVIVALQVAGCSTLPGGRTALSERDCMARVMYFESNRSSEEGMLAVGTTVMNRIQSGRYPRSVCGVVGQPGQFAEGALTKRMNPREAVLPYRTADRVLAGERYAPMGGAMFFHTAGLTFPYTNMHYTAVAGGNAFYEKVRFAQNTLPTTRFTPARSESLQARTSAAQPLQTAWGTRAVAPSPAPAPSVRRPRTIDDLLARASFGEASNHRIASAATASDFDGRY